MQTTDLELKNDPDGQNAIISVNLRDRIFTISGSEIFVQDNKDSVCAFVERNMSFKQLNPSKENTELEEQNNFVSHESEELPKPDFTTKSVNAGLYSLDSDDDSVLIHMKKISGSTSEQIRKIALIILYARKNELLSSSDLRKYCIKYDCYDGNHTASIFENNRVNFIKKNVSTRKWTLKLTPSGIDKSKEVLDEMMPSV